MESNGCGERLSPQRYFGGGVKVDKMLLNDCKICWLIEGRAT